MELTYLFSGDDQEWPQNAPIATLAAVEVLHLHLWIIYLMYLWIKSINQINRIGESDHLQDAKPLEWCGGSLGANASDSTIEEVVGRPHRILARSYRCRYNALMLRRSHLSN